MYVTLIKLNYIFLNELHKCCPIHYKVYIVRLNNKVAKRNKQGVSKNMKRGDDFGVLSDSSERMKERILKQIYNEIVR